MIKRVIYRVNGPVEQILAGRGDILLLKLIEMVPLEASAMHVTPELAGRQQQTVMSVAVNLRVTFPP
jgi:hypothetical protein